MDEAQPTVPYGFCQCGCGERAPIAKYHSVVGDYRKGEPARFVRGHNNRGRAIKPVRYVVEDRGYETACWIWQLQIAENGYGSVSVNRRPYRAHRLYWEAINGAVPDGMVLDHLCSVRACVNPAHLEAVTHEENCRRGRSTKLTSGDVSAIRRLIAEGQMLQVAIAAQFGVSPATISEIRHGRKWART